PRLRAREDATWSGAVPVNEALRAAPAWPPASKTGGPFRVSLPHQARPVPSRMLDHRQDLVGREPACEVARDPLPRECQRRAVPLRHAAAAPVALDYKLEASDLGCCHHCRCWLYYQRTPAEVPPWQFYLCARG